MIAGEPDAIGVIFGVPMHLPLIILTVTLAGIAGCEERAMEVALDKIPAPVTAAAVAALPGFVASTANSEAEDGSVSYDLRGTVAGLKAKVEIEVAADGTITVEETESHVALDQVPAATRDAAIKAAPGLQIVTAEREVKHDEVSWTLEGTAAGKKVEVEVKADGSTDIESGDGEHNDTGDRDHDMDEHKGRQD
jgi:uncharacterized protein (DUF39 family)